MASQIQQLHFLLIPLLSQSHLIPFTDMAKLLAHRGVTVTIVTTPLNAVRYKKIIDRAINSNLKIQVIPLRFPCQEAGLPEGCENLDTVPSPDLIRRFHIASSLLQEPLETLVEEFEPRPSCMICDGALPWTSYVAVKFNIPRLVFNSISCFTLLCSHNMIHYKVEESVESDSESFLVPDMPDKIELTKAQLPRTFKRGPDGMGDFREQMKEAQESAHGVVLNSFEELEPRYVKGYEKVGKKLWCIGPVSLCNKDLSDKFERGNKSSIDEDQCMKWLDSREPSSVIYACFGSICHILPSQLIEIGLGLEASNRPFIWIIREGNHSIERFEERVNGRGLIIRGWAPQVLILSHPATGGFLTHCGWNSTLEGVCAGVPMITWPMFAEQFYNEKFVVQVLRTGVRIGVEVSMHWGEEEKVGVLVNREAIKKAIDQLMDKGEEGEERRNRAKEFGKMAKMAMEEGGSSYLNITLLIQDIMQQISHKESTHENSSF